MQLPALAHARDGAYFELGYGYNWWNLDRPRIEKQLPGGNAVDFFAPLQNAQAATVRVGYNVLGHAHIGAHLMGTGWNVTDASRGGGGYVGGEVGWHPLQLAHVLLKNGLPYRQYYDFWVEGGYGYSIVGKDNAMDGGVGEFGLGAEGCPLPWLSLGLRTTWYFADYNRYIYNYDGHVYGDLPNHSGGSFFAFTVFIGLHFGYSEEQRKPAPVVEEKPKPEPAPAPEPESAPVQEIRRVQPDPEPAPAPAPAPTPAPAPKPAAKATTAPPSAKKVEPAPQPSKPLDDATFKDIFGEDGGTDDKPAPKKKKPVTKPKATGQ
jgi:hypothetical protein